MSLPSLTIYIANMAEDVWQYLDTLPSNRKAADIRGCDLTSDRELMSFLDTENFVLISPVVVDPLFIEYTNSLKPLTAQAGKAILQILTPAPKTGQISLDITHDNNCLDAILSFSQKYQVNLESYTASSQFIGLVTYLKEKDSTIHAPLTPSADDKGVVDYFGSKSGLRHYYETHHLKCDSFSMPAGKVCANKIAAIAYAKSLYQSGLGVVFKTPKGHSGIGVVIVKKSESPVDFNPLLKEPYWDQFPLIVEEYVPINHAVGGGTPNAEGFIDKTGQVQILYTCGMRMDQSGGFQGMEIGLDVLPQAIAAKLTDLGNFLGLQYAQKGYRGYFDIDGMIDDNGHLLISESNVRRTGGTHVFRLAQSLLGKDFARHHYLISNNYFPLQANTWTLSRVLQHLSSILYNPVKKSGLIITGANTLQDNFLSYAILAKNKSEALAIEAEMKTILSLPISPLSPSTWRNSARR